MLLENSTVEEYKKTVILSESNRKRYGVFGFGEGKGARPLIDHI